MKYLNQLSPKDIYKKPNQFIVEHNGVMSANNGTTPIADTIPRTVGSCIDDANGM
jgi:hypothetical protein